jgi:hypothetical protein
MTTPLLILGVPGPWRDLDELASAVATANNGYAIADAQLCETATGTTYDLDLYEHDPSLRRAFEAAGEGRLAPAELDRIAQHRHTAYLIGPGGSVENARAAARAAVALLDAGGFAVKIESAGKAHTVGYWRETAVTTDLFRLYSAYVVLVGGRPFFYSCGMHNLGLPDATVSSDLGPKEGAHVLNNFHNYQLKASRPIQNGHTFQITASEPTYRVTLEPCRQFPAGKPFHNPYGVWHLAAVEG